MKTESSIHALNKSFDVYEGHLHEVISIVKEELKDTYNTNLEPFIRPLKSITIQEITYKLFESYFDSASEDYFYFAVKE
jgi:hypothetical protein